MHLNLINTKIENEINFISEVINNLTLGKKNV
jgi:hypothetical protein